MREKGAKASPPEDGEAKIRKGRYDGDDSNLGVVIMGIRVDDLASYDLTLPDR
jgi:hypothetical protein